MYSPGCFDRAFVSAMQVTSWTAGSCGSIKVLIVVMVLTLDAVVVTSYVDSPLYQSCSQLLTPVGLQRFA